MTRSEAADDVRHLRLVWLVSAIVTVAVVAELLVAGLGCAVGDISTNAFGDIVQGSVALLAAMPVYQTVYVPAACWLAARRWDRERQR